jgi:hypothetical protein
MVQGQAVFIGYGVFEGQIFSADPTELLILSHRQHGTSLLQRFLEQRGSPALEDRANRVSLFFRGLAD